MAYEQLIEKLMVTSGHDLL